MKREMTAWCNAGASLARPHLWVTACIVAFVLCNSPLSAQTEAAPEDLLVVPVEGHPGGRLVTSLRSDPKTLNPVTALDARSREAIALLFADLIHVNVYTMSTEPSLAKSWKVSPDGKHYALELRQGIRFSDGQPFDADDVIFSFKVYLDEKVHSPQRDLLKIGDQTISVHKEGKYRIAVDLPQAYSAAERLFDSVNILPRHLLEGAYELGKLSEMWNPATPPEQIAGLGPFRLKEYVAGQRLVLERNPFYWKQDRARHRLPYLDEMVFLIIPSQDAEVIRFQAGDLDLLDNVSAEDYAVLARDQVSRGYTLHDLGPGFEYDFLFFNLNNLPDKQLPEVARRQEWFRRDEFRQAVSAAIDREAIVRLAYQGRATPLWGHVTPGNRLWIDQTLPHPSRSLEKAMSLLRSAGFSRRTDGTLTDSQGAIVEFSIVASSNNAQRMKMATIIQDDLSQLGMRVNVVPLEFQAVVTRIFNSFDYDASILGLISGDADPNPEINVWTSGGGTHVWAPSETRAANPWQAELDRLMHEQTTMLDHRARKQLYDRVQVLVTEHVPVICMVSPNVLVGIKNSLGGVRPAVMRRHLLWNADQIYLVPGRSSHP